MAETPHPEPVSTPPRRMLDLPADLHAAIARALAAAPAARWIRAAQALSERYRATRADYDRAPVTGEDQWLGYAALMMPATYAQLRGAMAAAAARIPRWAPASLLDLGSGPGTALWAAVAQWPTLRSQTAWERETAAIALGRALARGSESAVVRAARWERVDLLAIDQQTENREPRTENRQTENREPPRGYPTENRQPERRTTDHGPRTGTIYRAPTDHGPRTTDHGPRTYDLVVLGHVLNELDVEARRAVVDAAWRLTGGLLLIVEPGTPAGFAVARAARDALLGAGARTIAPCMHDRPCPLEADWCHFSQRLKRPDFQRRAAWRALGVGRQPVRLCRTGALRARGAGLGARHPRAVQQQSLCRGKDLVGRGRCALPCAETPPRCVSAGQAAGVGRRIGSAAAGGMENEE